MKTLNQQEKERLKPLLVEFANECIFSWDDITGVDISIVGLIDRGATEKDGAKACFVVYLKRLPKSCHRTEEYRGIRVYWVVKTPKE